MGSDCGSECRVEVRKCTVDSDDFAENDAVDQLLP